ncbi:MAG TPA: hypothetical protein VI136_20775 [Verrucomicrobiae bacterium]
MSACRPPIQGAPVVTFDTDIWIDLPAKHYMRPANICLKLGATMRANTVFIFDDDTMVNFLYVVTGLRSFAAEYRSAVRVRWLGLRDVRVLPLSRIYHSKEAIRRPKDLVHMEVPKQLMACGNRLARTPRPQIQGAKKRRTRSG